MLRTRDPVARFEAQISKDEHGCWLWQGKLNGGGYAVFKVNGSSSLVHRWAYEHFKGPLAKGMVLDHLCKVSRCVNPGHLEVVTVEENNKRARTQCQRGHLFTEENTRVLRSGFRRCRTCLQQDRELRRQQQQGHRTTSIKITLEVEPPLIPEVEAALMKLKRERLITTFHIDRT